MFVTVGTQLPFDRLVRTVDSWAASHGEREVVVQQGRSTYEPRHCRCLPYIAPTQWEALFGAAELVVSHAGMGTILKCLDQGKPLIMMPRLARLGEHRNDHQMATAERFAAFPNIRVVDDEAGLLAALDNPPPAADGVLPAGNANLERLIIEMRRFIHSSEGVA